MRTVFREDHEMFRDMARRFIDREIVPHLHDWEKAGIVPRDVWLKAGAADRAKSRSPTSQVRLSMRSSR